jgi:hypothetical protein
MPGTPDSIVLRVVQVDAPADKPWDEPINTLTDGFKTAAVFIVETGKDDLLSAIWRDGADLRFRDETNPGSGSGGYTLAELLAGSGGLTSDAHKALRQLIHFIEDGPAEGFASGAYRETTGTVTPTAIVWYTDSGKTDKIVERLITWSGILPTVDKWKIYDTDGSTVLWTVSDSISYSGIFETSRTRTITSGDA